MSNSSIFLSSPLSYCKSLIRVPEKYATQATINKFHVLLWTLSGLYSVAKVQFNSNITGSTYTLPICDILLMLSASYLLSKGIKWKNSLITLPWMLLTGCSLFFNQYNGIMANIQTLKQIRYLSYLPWTNVAMNCLLLVIRLTLTIRMFQLYIFWWFRKKLDMMKN